jgi:hypothetical protein
MLNALVQEANVNPSQNWSEIFCHPPRGAHLIIRKATYPENRITVKFAVAIHDAERSASAAARSAVC